MWPTITKFDADCGDLKGKEFTGENRHAMKLIQAVNMWPTIRATDGEHGGPNQRDSAGNPALPSAVKMWATPNAADCQGTTGGGQGRSLRTDVRLWATPQTTNAHGKGKHGQGGDNLQTQCNGQLNPDWTECMVGLPIGWTNPDIKEVSRENPNRWPSFMGQPQHEWEPPRTCGKMPNRAKRLKMCGNICIAQQIHPILRAIADIERSNYDRIA